jgi:hypothetical protein
MLVREIAVTPVEIPRRATCVKILWHTGQVSELLVARPSKGEAVTTPPALIERVRDLAAQGKGDAEIAADGIAAWAAEVGQIRKRYFDGKFKIGAGPQLADK